MIPGYVILFLGIWENLLTDEKKLGVIEMSDLLVHGEATMEETCKH